MLYHLHFDELGAYDYDRLDHDIYFESDDKIDVDQIFEELDCIKNLMDDGATSAYEDYGFTREYAEMLAEKYYGSSWDQKIDDAFEMAMEKHPEYHYKLASMEYFQYGIY